MAVGRPNQETLYRMKGKQVLLVEVDGSSCGKNLRNFSNWQLWILGRLWAEMMCTAWKEDYRGSKRIKKFGVGISN